MRLRPWIMLSSIGVGTYLGDEDDTTDEEVSVHVRKLCWCLHM